MSFSNDFEAALLDLIFLNTNIANIGDATGLRGSSTAGTLYLELHTSDPGEAGDQTTNACAYTSHARVGLPRSGSYWTRTGNSVSPVSEVTFPAATGGTETATHFSVGVASSGAGMIILKGTVSPSIDIASGVTPKLTTATTLTVD